MSVDSFDDFREPKRKRGSFTKRESDSYKNRQVKRILKDIEEARSFGISLHAITLAELYSYLKDAWRQKNAFQKKHPKGHFVYDPMEDEQPPFDNGLDQLARTLKKTSKTSARRKRHRSTGRKRPAG